ncbi:MAG: metal-dependent hydrolase [Planctomycetota bacterium]|nr:metal-dependent hydrolase [Planctomycetota bacterium]
MADYRTHITTSGILGTGYGLAATLGAGFTPVQGMLAAVLTGVAGMLPDLDSDSGRPVREVFGLLAAVAPLLMHNRLVAWGGGTEPAILLSVLLYIAIRYGLSTLLQLLSVHRGMYHSIPALFIAAEATYLAYLTDAPSVRGLMALGVGLGFASHLILDEIYSVRWNGATIQLKPSAGSAVKLLGKSWPANIFASGLALTLGYAVLVDGGLNSVDRKHADRNPREQAQIPNPKTHSAEPGTGSIHSTTHSDRKPTPHSRRPTIGEDEEIDLRRAARSDDRSY